MGLIRGLSTLRTDRKPRKFASAEAKRQYLEYRAWQEELRASLKPAAKQPERLRVDYSHVRETPVIPSRMETDLAVAPRKEARPYEGERQLLGIATLHKSVMQPVFDKEYAKDVAKMRRG